MVAGLRIVLACSAAAFAARATGTTRAVCAAATTTGKPASVTDTRAEDA
jgi:hypothetical protein